MTTFGTIPRFYTSMTLLSRYIDTFAFVTSKRINKLGEYRHNFNSLETTNIELHDIDVLFISIWVTVKYTKVWKNTNFYDRSFYYSCKYVYAV